MLTEGQDFYSTETEPIEGQKTLFISCRTQACLLFSVVLMVQLAECERRVKMGRKCSFSVHRRSLEEPMQKDCSGRSYCVVIAYFTLHNFSFYR